MPYVCAYLVSYNNFLVYFIYYKDNAYLKFKKLFIDN